jgi:hypothetical protein
LTYHGSPIWTRYPTHTSRLPPREIAVLAYHCRELAVLKNLWREPTVVIDSRPMEAGTNQQWESCTSRSPSKEPNSCGTPPQAASSSNKPMEGGGLKTSSL